MEVILKHPNHAFSQDTTTVSIDTALLARTRQDEDHQDGGSQHIICLALPLLVLIPGLNYARERTMVNSNNSNNNNNQNNGLGDKIKRKIYGSLQVAFGVIQAYMNYIATLVVDAFVDVVIFVRDNPRACKIILLGAYMTWSRTTDKLIALRKEYYTRENEYYTWEKKYFDSYAALQKYHLTMAEDFVDRQQEYRELVRESQSQVQQALSMAHQLESMLRQMESAICDPDFDLDTFLMTKCPEINGVFETDEEADGGVADENLFEAPPSSSTLEMEKEADGDVDYGDVFPEAPPSSSFESAVLGEGSRGQAQPQSKSEEAPPSPSFVPIVLADGGRGDAQPQSQG